MTMPWTHPYKKSTRIEAFRRNINRKYNLDIKSFAELHAWSTSNLVQFNQELWEFCGMIYSVPPEKVTDDIDRMWPPPEWFPGARLNFTENILAIGLATHPDAVAISACREEENQWKNVTWKELSEEVKTYAAALRAAGLGKGDRIATMSTNSIETVILLLAAGWIGAIFSSTAPDMGVNGIVERFVQIQPKLIFVESSVRYGGRALDLRPKLAEIMEQINKRTSGVRGLVDISGQIWQNSTVQSFQTFLSARSTEILHPVQVSFDHPIYILYSSGTTGPPKCICHAGGRALLQQKKEYLLHLNLGPDSTGWMMWNYLVGALATGARILLYDGNPLFPSPSRQLKMISEQGVTHWGTSPKFLAALRQSGIRGPIQLEDLEFVLSAGSPLSSELFKWFYTWAPKHVGLLSGSGGTDLVGGIVGGNPLATIHSGELAAANLGMKVEIWDRSGKNIDYTGREGDLVVTKPFLSMPVTFWGPEGHEKYRKAYFDDFPGVWSHGDFIKQDPKTGSYEILGRSDGVLNPGGVRFGTAEIYGILETFGEIEDYIAVGQRRDRDTDEQVLLFLKIKTGKLDASLRDRIAATIRKQLSPRHVPAYIIQVRDIPYTMNGKRIENLVRDIVCGKSITIGGTASNPECLDEYKSYVDLPMASKQHKL